MDILLVEDDHDSRIGIAKFLRELGHRLVECGNGEEALKAFQPSFNMVLSDIKMPKMSGIELLREISGRPGGQDVDVVLFTGFNDLESAVDALRAGAYDYMLKPINIEELAAVVGRVQEHQALRRENKVLTRNLEDQVKAAKAETEKELNLLKEAYARTLGLGEIGVFSSVLRDLFKQATALHNDRSIPVLIEGETGTGKEIIARYIHFGSGLNAIEPFIDINCAALAPTVFESELFGYEAGAFTGGLPRGKRGKLDMAMGGTLFLDEIADLPIDLQAKLLRVIQEKEFYRVGGLKKIKVDVRIVCATNVDLAKRVEQGLFRQDLYYRLNVGRLFLPPLRERVEEIVPLAGIFLKEYAQKKKKKFLSISETAARMLEAEKWPGNIRELKNAIDCVVLMHDDSELKPEHLGILKKNKANGSINEKSLCPFLQPENFSLPEEMLDLESYIDKIVVKAMNLFYGNKTETARYLGISRSSLYCRLERIEKRLNS